MATAGASKVGHGRPHLPPPPAGKETGLVVQDASAFAAEDEQLSFLQLQARAAMVRQVRLPSKGQEREQGVGAL